MKSPLDLERVELGGEDQARFSGYLKGCVPAIGAVPVGRFALLLVTRDEIDVRAVPDEHIENLLVGVAPDDCVAQILERQRGLSSGPGYREHLVIVMELADVEVAWEPPNVHGVGAAAIVITARPVGSA